MLTKITWLAVAGAAGTVARFGLATLVQRLHQGDFPIGTLAVNMIGCFVVGLLWSVAEHRWHLGPEVRLIVLIGFMGSFTTFSAFVLETNTLYEQAGWIQAVSNIALQNGLGLALLFAGLNLGRQF